MAGGLRAAGAPGLDGSGAFFLGSDCGWVYKWACEWVAGLQKYAGARSACFDAMCDGVDEDQRRCTQDRGGLPRIVGMQRRAILSSVTTVALATALTALPLTPAWSLDGLPQKFDPARNAVADVEQALSQARSQRKLVFIDLGGEWCSWCHIFDRFIASRAEVQKVLAERYVMVKVNYSPQQRNEQLLSRFPKARGYPHFYVLDAGGKVLASQDSGELESGKDYDEAKVLAFLRRHAPGT